jgi:hypothetical protein
MMKIQMDRKMYKIVTSKLILVEESIDVIFIVVIVMLEFIC